MPEARDRFVDLQKTVLHAGIEQLGRRRERDGAHAPLEQLDPQQRLQRADLMADRARTDVQLLRGLGQAQMPSRGLEGPQCIEWWHLIHEKISLIGRNHILCNLRKQRNITRTNGENYSSVRENRRLKMSVLVHTP